MNGMIVFLAGFSGALGLVIGMLVSAAAQEELAQGERLFKILKNVLFLIIAAIFLYQAGMIALVIGLTLITLIVKKYEGEAGDIPVVLTIIMLILTASTPLFEFIAGMFLLFGLAEAGWWSATHRKLLAEGVWRKQLWKTLLQEESFIFLLPLAGVVFAVG